jgi:hypothetical protein
MGTARQEDSSDVIDLYEELKTLVGKFDEAKIDYALCGGMALAIYGIPRATLDLDLLIPQEALGEASQIAQESGYTFIARPMVLGSGAISIHRFSKKDEETGFWLSLNFLLVTPSIEDVWKERKALEWEAGRIQVVSRAGLIRLKSLRKSGQDLDDIGRLKEGTDED